MFRKIWIFILEVLTIGGEAYCIPFQEDREERGDRGPSWSRFRL